MKFIELPSDHLINLDDVRRIRYDFDCVDPHMHVIYKSGIGERFSIPSYDFFVNLKGIILS